MYAIILLLIGALLLLSVAAVVVGLLMAVLGKGRGGVPRVGGWMAGIASLFVLAFGITATVFLVA